MARKKQARRSRRRRSRKRSQSGISRPDWRGRLLRGLRFCVLASLPLVFLIRGAVAAHSFLRAPGWIAVAMGGFLSTLAVAAWITWFAQKLSGARRTQMIARRAAIPIVVIFSLFVSGWLSHMNAKTADVAERWSDLHPVLRLAIGTAILADSDVVITDISRMERDYDRMGLARPRRSMHYTQPDGWVHAVDLRTLGHSELRNGIGRTYFRLMGFQTLRHGGSGDHLHVALPRR